MARQAPAGVWFPLPSPFVPPPAGPRAAGRFPPSSDWTLEEASAAGASAGRPRGTSLPGGPGVSSARLRAQGSRSRRRPTSARFRPGRGCLERRGARAPGEMGACPRGARWATPVRWGRCPPVLPCAGMTGMAAPGDQHPGPSRKCCAPRLRAQPSRCAALGVWARSCSVSSRGGDGGVGRGGRERGVG